MNIFLLQYTTWQVVREVRTSTTSLGNSVYAQEKKKRKRAAVKVSCLAMDPSCQLNSSIKGFKYKQLFKILSACKPWENPQGKTYALKS